MVLTCWITSSKQLRNAYLKNVVKSIRKKVSTVKNVLRSKMSISTNFHIVYSTQQTSLSQDDISGGYLLSVGREEYFLDRYTYSHFRKNIKAIDLVTLLSSKTPDIEILKIRNSNRFLIVDIHCAIELKELIDGACAMFELNTCIHKGIRRKSLHA